MSHRPILHPTTEIQIGSLRHSLPQGIILAGDRGVGLKTIALWLAADNLAGIVAPTDVKGATDEDGSISVDATRQLYQDTRAKQSSRQIYIIDDADRMTASAQAAFLKLLEEPSPMTHFILTSHHSSLLASTILSRVQQTIVHPITDVQTVEFIKHLGIIDQTRRIQLQYIAKGLPAELQRLHGNEEHFAMRAKIITDARTFLQAPAYDRLMIASRHQSDRPATLALIDCTLMILRQAIRTKPDVAIVNQLEKLLSLRENIAAQHNIRLQLTRFVL